MTTTLKPSPQKLYGDPRTTGRRETASQRKHRKRQSQRRWAQGGYVQEMLMKRTGGAAAKAAEAMQNIISQMGITEEQMEKFAESIADGQCHELTTKGTRCKNRVKAGVVFCKTHS